MADFDQQCLIVKLSWAVQVLNLALLVSLALNSVQSRQMDPDLVQVVPNGHYTVQDLDPVSNDFDLVQMMSEVKVIQTDSVPALIGFLFPFD